MEQTKQQKLQVQTNKFKVLYATLYMKMRGQELRDRVTDFEAEYVYTLLNDDNTSEDVEKKCGGDTNDRWIVEVVKEPLQRQNAWKEEDITKLLD
jgi:osmotically-inducible protein OsmY